MDNLGIATKSTLLANLKPHVGSTWECDEEVKEKLSKLNKDTKFRMFGSYRFRLADDEPSFYVQQILIL